MIVTHDTKKIAKRIMSELDDAYYLTYVDYRDTLENQHELIEALLKNPDHGRQLFYDENDEWLWEQEAETISQTIRELCQPGEYEALLGSDEWEEIADHIRDRDKSDDPLPQLLKNTGNVWITYDLDYEASDPYTSEDSTAVAARKIAKAAGISYKKNKEPLHELVANAGYGGQLKLLWSGDISPLLDADPKKDALRFEKPELALVDYWNGSGHDVTLNEPMTVPLNRDRLELDTTHNYSYAEKVCGLYAPAFYDNAPDVVRKRKGAK